MAIYCHIDEILVERVFAVISVSVERESHHFTPFSVRVSIVLVDVIFADSAVFKICRPSCRENSHVQVAIA